MHYSENNDLIIWARRYYIAHAFLVPVCLLSPFAYFLLSDLLGHRVDTTSPDSIVLVFEPAIITVFSIMLVICFCMYFHEKTSRANSDTQTFEGQQTNDLEIGKLSEKHREMFMLAVGGMAEYHPSILNQTIKGVLYLLVAGLLFGFSFEVLINFSGARLIGTIVLMLSIEIFLFVLFRRKLMMLQSKALS
jgi:hypothetical protein